jgi:hypothetical protein
VAKFNKTISKVAFCFCLAITVGDTRRPADLLSTIARVSAWHPANDQ